METLTKKEDMLKESNKNKWLWFAMNTLAVIFGIAKSTELTIIFCSLGIIFWIDQRYFDQKYCNTKEILQVDK